jgi:Zn-dependent M16 (insulinase) family peptidase
MGSILSNSYLHREIREKGGAYGAGCSLLTRRGLLNLWSYRDPNILKTIERYNNIELGIVSDREL